MKNSVLILGLILSAVNSSCSSDDVLNEQVVEKTAPVTVRVRDFSMSVEDFSASRTRATSTVANYDGVKAITLAFYDSHDAEVYQTTQLRTAVDTYTTFGEFACSLPMGRYTMVVLGYGSMNAMTLSGKTSATFTNDRVRETFVYTETVNVTNTAALALSATLSRVVAQVAVVSTDVRTADAAKIRTTFSAGGPGVDPTTGLSTTDTGFSNIIDIASAVGSISQTGSYLFLNSDQQTMDVTIDVLDDADQVLSHKVVNDVPFRRNRRTFLTGSLYSTAPGSVAFSVETAWLPETNVNF